MREGVLGRELDGGLVAGMVWDLWALADGMGWAVSMAMVVHLFLDDPQHPVPDLLAT